MVLYKLVLQALGALVPRADNKVLTDLLPALAKLNLDRAHQVRPHLS
jgi:hypothetical protein